MKDWMQNAVDKASRENLVKETEQGAYNDFIASRLGGSLRHAAERAVELNANLQGRCESGDANGTIGNRGLANGTETESKGVSHCPRNAAPAAPLQSPRFGEAEPLQQTHVVPAIPRVSVKKPTRQSGQGAQTSPSSSRPRVNRGTARRRLGYKLNDNGARLLICAVVEQAVSDFKLLSKRGRIVSGKIIRKGNGGGFVRDAENQAIQTLHFFSKAGPLDEWLAVAGIEVNPNLVRKKLGII